MAVIPDQGPDGPTQVGRVPRRVRREDGPEAQPEGGRHHHRPRHGEDEDAERQ